MNIGYALAVGAARRRRRCPSSSPRALDADDVWELIPKITAHHDPEFDKDPSGGGKTSLSIRFADGT